MKDFYAKEWVNYEQKILKHGDAYTEHNRGDIFTVFCPECGDPDVRVFDECVVEDSEMDEIGFFWADYKCKKCGCEFRGRFNRKYSVKDIKNTCKMFKIARYFCYVAGIITTLILAWSDAEDVKIAISFAVGCGIATIFGILEIIFYNKYLKRF